MQFLIKPLTRIPNSLVDAQNLYLELYGEQIRSLSFISDTETRELYKLTAIKKRSSPFAIMQADHSLISSISGRSGIICDGMYFFVFH